MGIVVAVPTIIVSGPLFAKVASRLVDVPTPDLYDVPEGRGQRPSFAITVATVLLPVVLMMAKALADVIFNDAGNALQKILDFIGNPFIALLIVAAGGGFKQTLVDTGIAQVITDFVQNSGVSVLLLAWFVAVLIRLATGSATVATVTAAGIMAPVASSLPTGEVSLLVLAIGAGSLFFSHVNDAGFWLVKEYFGLTVGQTIKSWSLMETILSVSGLLMVLLLNLVI